MAVDITIAYNEDLNRAFEVLKQAGDRLAVEWTDLITEGPEVLGVVALDADEVVVRMSAWAMPLQHWKVERELRRRAKEALDAVGIKHPAMLQMEGDIPHGSL